MIYIAARWALKNNLRGEAAMLTLKRLNVYSAIFGLGCMMLSFAQSGKENIGVTYDQLGAARIANTNPLPSIKSLSVEPNVFAISTAVILCLNLSIYFLWQKSKKQLFVIGILTLAVIFAYTRSVYVTLILALVVMILLSNRIRLLFAIVNYGLLIALLLSITLYFLPKTNTVKVALTHRVTTLFEFKSGSGEGRLEGLKIAWGGFKQNPVFGNGTLSAETSFYNPWRNRMDEKMGSAGWLNGALIQALHDTGAIGFAIVFSLYCSVLFANYRVLKTAKHPPKERSIIIGFIAGNIILFIASQTSSTLWIAFPYIYWAINLAYIAHVKKTNNPSEI
jgi:O-antigen ligase